MGTKHYSGTPYHVWNPSTDVDKFEFQMGIGPSVIVRGQGPYIFNDRGQRFISGLSGLWNVAVGYGREELVEAATKQMRELPYGSSFRQVHPRAIELAAKLVEITGARYHRVYLGSNGSEAIETALKVARQFHRQSPSLADRGRFKIISLRGAYHGVTYGAISTAGLERHEAKFGPLVPGFLQVEPPYCYRCTLTNGGPEDCGLQCARALEQAIVREGPETVAAFIFEPIMGFLGVIDPPPGYYKMVVEICRKYGVLVIADEVTTGFGRTGKLFVSQDWEAGPDILCAGKAISSGYFPVAATLFTREVYDRFHGAENYLDDGSTASGHPVGAAVALANIDIMLRERLAENAAEVGEHLKRRLLALKEKHDRIGEVRGQGLMLALELVSDRESKAPVTPAEAENVLLNLITLGLLLYVKPSGVVGLWPPLIIDRALADEIADIVDKALTRTLTARIGHMTRFARAVVEGKLPHR